MYRTNAAPPAPKKRRLWEPRTIAFFVADLALVLAFMRSVIFIYAHFGHAAALMSLGSSFVLSVHNILISWKRGAIP